METVLAFGTFDILHPGHLSYLKQARGLGERLVVVVATDKNVEKIKGKKPVNDEEHRRELVASLGIVDEALIGGESDFYEVIEKVKPAVIALGYDQEPGNDEVKKKLAERGLKAKIARLEPFNEGVYKSSKIKERILGDANGNDN